MKRLIIAFSIHLLMQVAFSQTEIQIIADHTVVDKYDDIPQNWIDSVKNMLVWIPGMSHGSGYFNGAELLELYDSKFQVSIWYETDPPAPSSSALRLGRIFGARENFYTSAESRSVYKSYIEDAESEGNPFHVIGFGWSYTGTWENPPGGGLDPVYNIHWAGSSQGGPDGNLRWGLNADDNTLTGNSVNMDTYLAAIEDYNVYSVNNGYSNNTIFTTLAVDGDAGTEAAFQRELKSQYIRDYVKGHSDAILFDYADILCWNNAGVKNTATWNDNGNLRTHNQIHPDNLKDYDNAWNIISQSDDGDHIGEVGALRLAKAMWWMLARIAGWNGENTTTSISETSDKSKSIYIYDNINEKLIVNVTDDYLNADIRIYNLLGTLIDSGKIYDNINYLNTSNFTEGLYLVCLFKGDLNEVKKISIIK